MNLIQGETVVVVRPTVTYDGLGEPSYGDDRREYIEDVVVYPGPTSDLDASRPQGAKVAYTLCIPKSYAGGSLKGLSVEVRGRTYRVVGDPQRYTAANTPWDWDLTAEVEDVEG